MADRFQVAIIGSGPAGLSAAGRAAERGLSHVLLEAQPHASNTIFKYQKGKHVMAEPAVLPLRSPMAFEEGKRETILNEWDEGLKRLKVNIRYQSEVLGISRHDDHFLIDIKGADNIQAEHVVLGIGLQGNPRKLGVDGEDAPFVLYTLDDPDDYHDKTVVVVGAGDAAIENAVALAKTNKVYIVNRRDEFARAKDGNLNLINQAIEAGKLECLYSTTVERLEEQAEDSAGKPGTMVFNTPDGQIRIPVDCVIARLGAIPPRRFVESCGIEFPSKDPASIPAVSAQYESNVPGLYIVGALGGYPLIKQAMNQGYEVIEFILGNDIKPADEPLLEEKFKSLPNQPGVDEVLARIQAQVPLLNQVTTLQLREFLLDSEVLAPDAEQTLFKRNDYNTHFYSIVDGQAHIQINPDDAKQRITLNSGQFFGEMGLISGRRANATTLAGDDCVLVQTPRRSMLKLIQSVDAVSRIIDETFLVRAVRGQLAPEVSDEDLHELVNDAELLQYKANDALFHEGDSGDGLYLIRVGSVTIARNLAGREVVTQYLAAGNYVGEMALLSDSPRSATVRANVNTTAIRLQANKFKAMVAKYPAVRERLEALFAERTQQNVIAEQAAGKGSITSFLIEQGIGEATDVLLIDESLCVRCDQCEKACAGTHENISRLNRQAGPTFANIHVPTSCRHCEHPHCMKDCPPDAIHRAPNGEVFIADNCIGCGNCQRNCPYGVIQMGQKGPEQPNLLKWLLGGWGPEPGTDRKGWAPNWLKPNPDAKKVAVKCDMCKGQDGGPACVRACPTGAAIRVSPEQFLDITEQG